MKKQIQTYSTMKSLCFGAFVIGVFTFATLSVAKAQEAILVDPPCETTTCISEEAILIAKGELVKRDDMLSHYELFEPIACEDPRATGVVVHRQIEKEIELYFDGFCTNQGCEPTVEDGTACE